MIVMRQPSISGIKTLFSLVVQAFYTVLVSLTVNQGYILVLDLEHLIQTVC